MGRRPAAAQIFPRLLRRAYCSAHAAPGNSQRLPRGAGNAQEVGPEAEEGLSANWKR
jgi:hypothetical protein